MANGWEARKSHAAQTEEETDYIAHCTAHSDFNFALAHMLLSPDPAEQGCIGVIANNFTHTDTDTETRDKIHTPSSSHNTHTHRGERGITCNIQHPTSNIHTQHIYEYKDRFTRVERSINAALGDASAGGTFEKLSHLQSLHPSSLLRSFSLYSRMQDAGCEERTGGEMLLLPPAFLFFIHATMTQEIRIIREFNLSNWLASQLPLRLHLLLSVV